LKLNTVTGCRTGARAVLVGDANFAISVVVRATANERQFRFAVIARS
jgi:hypothetical protein